MRNSLLESVRRFLPDLLATQRTLADLYARKQQALVQAQHQQLEQLEQPELELTRALQQHLRARRDILQAAREAQLPHASLRELVSAFDPDARAELQPLIRDSQELSRQLRRASSVHWIIARKCCQYYGDVLELFANCGRMAPTYAAHSDRETSGGAILDTTV